MRGRASSEGLDEGEGDGRTTGDKIKARVQIKKEKRTRRDEIQIGLFLPLEWL